MYNIIIKNVENKYDFAELIKIFLRPEEFNAYLSFLEEQLGVPVKIVSVGPDREQTIERYTEE